MGHEGRHLRGDNQHEHDQDDQRDEVGGAVAGVDSEQAGGDERNGGECGEDQYGGSSFVSVYALHLYCPGAPRARQGRTMCPWKANKKDVQIER